MRYTILACVLLTISSVWTQNPGEALQKALDKLTADIAAEKKRNDNTASDLQEIHSQLDSLKTQIENLETFTNTLESEIGELKVRDDVIDKNVTEIRNTTTKLVQNNGIWKKNFKVVKETFVLLQKKVSFKFSRFGGN